MALGIPNDFINGPLKDLGRTVDYFPVVKVTSNTEGDETIEPGPVKEINVVLYPNTVNARMQGKEGEFEKGDARMFSLPDDNVQVDALVNWEGRFYRLGIPVRRYADKDLSIPMFDYTLLHLFAGIPKGPVPGTGRFIGSYRGIPENAATGDSWYDTTDKQYKGYDGTSVVIIG